MSYKESINETIQNLASKRVFKQKNIYAFGANGFAENIIKSLEIYGYKLTGILDNALDKQGNSILGIQIFAPSILLGKTGNTVIIIASKYFHEMSSQLEQMGFESGVNIFQLVPPINREDIKQFWTERSKIDTSQLPLIENIVSLSGSHGLEQAQLQLNREKEILNRYLELKGSDIVVDLGAGIGRWSCFIADRVKKVYAVELINELSQIGKKLADDSGIRNIEFILKPAEAFISDEQVDIVLISGLLCLLDDEQYNLLIKNVGSYLKCGGRVFLREPISITGFANSLFASKGAHTALYRTPDMHISRFAQEGCTLREYGPFFKDDFWSTETKLCYFLFTKK